jgi:hypothetical protein
MKWRRSRPLPFVSALDHGCFLRLRATSVSDIGARRYSWEISIARGAGLTLSSTLVAGTVAEAKAKAAKLQRILLMGIEAESSLT